MDLGEMEASLVRIASSRPAGGYRETLSQTTTKNLFWQVVSVAFQVRFHFIFSNCFCLFHLFLMLETLSTPRIPATNLCSLCAVQRDLFEGCLGSL